MVESKKPGRSRTARQAGSRFFFVPVAFVGGGQGPVVSGRSGRGCVVAGLHLGPGGKKRGFVAQTARFGSFLFASQNRSKLFGRVSQSGRPRLSRWAVVSLRDNFCWGNRTFELGRQSFKLSSRVRTLSGGLSTTPKPQWLSGSPGRKVVAMHCSQPPAMHCNFAPNVAPPPRPLSISIGGLDAALAHQPPTQKRPNNQPRQSGRRLPA